ncbi:hypothetical protein CCR95_16960 [Thiocystis minor]|uniref:hypothetical protein n=1 Tax=Thiocystis minor TaxID=61597 RepID=UPI001911F107|nr:hypothetical protein [Thiocystis minor]MBK5965723.1 hypothetical protein [Thiocystis minor]
MSQVIKQQRVITAVLIGATALVGGFIYFRINAPALESVTAQETDTQTLDLEQLGRLRGEIDRLKSERLETGRELRAMNNELSSIKSQLSAIPRDVETSGANASMTGEPDVDAASQDPEQAALQAEEQIRYQTALIQTAFDKEEQDPKWAQSAELALNDHFQGGEVGSLSFDSMACRATLCRVEVSPANAQVDTMAFEQDYSKLNHLTPWPSEGFGWIDTSDQGAPQAVLYIVREGYSLPQ